MWVYYYFYHKINKFKYWKIQKMLPFVVRACNRAGKSAVDVSLCSPSISGKAFRLPVRPVVKKSGLISTYCTWVTSLSWLLVISAATILNAAKIYLHYSNIILTEKKNHMNPLCLVYRYTNTSKLEIHSC